MQPDVISIKEKLHERIDLIEDEKILQAFYIILEGYKNEAEDYVLTDAQLKELEKRETDHLAGKTKSYTLEEIKKSMNDKYGY
jgi:hypothetical protein